MKFTCPIATVLLVLIAGISAADVVLIFDQAGVVNASLIDAAYGDRIVASPDLNGHSYGFIGLDRTPDVEVNYGGGTLGGESRLWTTGYGDLANVLYNEIDGDDALTIQFVADPGLNVGLFGFDMAAFGGVDQLIAGIDIRDGAGTILWSDATPTISGTTHNNFDIAGGVFGNQLTINIDLNGLGGNSDNIGIDNIQFAQVTAIPEPAAASVALLAIAGICVRRKRNF